jgi:hypothetical protein
MSVPRLTEGRFWFLLQKPPESGRFWAVVNWNTTYRSGVCRWRENGREPAAILAYCQSRILVA